LLLFQNVCPCNCVMFSRKAWNDSGNYWLDEELTSSEDVDFWVHLSRKHDFYELKLIDCEDSYRTEPNGQMTGNRDFAMHRPMLFKRWREFANNKKWVIENQNAILKACGLNPDDYGL
jgi:hypothetical protein